MRPAQILAGLAPERAEEVLDWLAELYATSGVADQTDADQTDASELVSAWLTGQPRAEAEDPDLAAWLAGDSAPAPDAAGPETTDPEATAGPTGPAAAGGPGGAMVDWSVLSDAQVLDRVRAAAAAEQKAQWARSEAITHLHARWTRPHLGTLIDDLIDDNPDHDQAQRLRRTHRRWRLPLRPHTAHLTGRDQTREADRFDADILAEAFVVAEVALANATSERQAREWLRIGTALTTAPGHFPRTAAALREGRLDWAKARTIVDTLTGHHPATIALIEATVVAETALPHPDTSPADQIHPTIRTIPALTSRLRELLLLHDPDADDTARAAEREDRRVYTRVISPVTGEVVAVLPLEQVAAIAARLDAAAHTARRNRDPRTPDQVRADTFTTLLLNGTIPGAAARPAASDTASGTATDTARDTATAASSSDTGGPPATGPRDTGPGVGPEADPGVDPPQWAAAPDPPTIGDDDPVTVVAHVTLTLETLLGLRDDPAYLDRFGPIPAALARDLARTASFRCVITDTTHGTVLGLGQPLHQTSYRPGQRLNDLIRTTWPTCSFPGCRTPAKPVSGTGTGSRCDLDHTTPWPTGTTCSCNLSPLCRKHHQMKTHGLITLEPSTNPTDPPGTLHWRMPSGRAYTSSPPPITPRHHARTPPPPPAPVRPTFTHPDEPPPF